MYCYLRQSISSFISAGDYCELDMDGCQDNPCTGGTNCTDFTPDEQVVSGLSFNCSECPAGTEDDDGICLRGCFFSSSFLFYVIFIFFFTPTSSSSSFTSSFSSFSSSSSSSSASSFSCARHQPVVVTDLLIMKYLLTDLLGQESHKYVI